MKHFVNIRLKMFLCMYTPCLVISSDDLSSLITYSLYSTYMSYACKHYRIYKIVRSQDGLSLQPGAKKRDISLTNYHFFTIDCLNCFKSFS